MGNALQYRTIYIHYGRKIYTRIDIKYWTTWSAKQENANLPSDPAVPTNKI